MNEKLTALGFDSETDLAPGEDRAVSSSPRVAFAAGRLIVPSEIGAFFELRRVIISGEDRMLNEQPLPCKVFSENAVGVALNVGECPGQTPMVLHVRNVSLSPCRFFAAALGTIR